MQTIDVSGPNGKARSGKTAAKRPRSTSRAKETLHLKPKEEAALPSRDELAIMIATAAYYRAERRQFEPGHELEDWLTAERQVRETLHA